MPAVTKRSAKKAAFAKPCDFSKFKIDDKLKLQLEQVGSLGCDSIWYGGLPVTFSSGVIDGYNGFFERRQEGYAGLVAEAMDIIERMLEEFDLTLPAKPDYYRQREGLVSAIQKAGENNSLRRKAGAVAHSNGSNVL